MKGKWKGYAVVALAVLLAVGATAVGFTATDKTEGGKQVAQTRADALLRGAVATTAFANTLAQNQITLNAIVRCGTVKGGAGFCIARITSPQGQAACAEYTFKPNGDPLTANIIPTKECA